MSVLKNRLKQVRQKAGLSLAEVGNGVGLATNTISRYENGKREPKLETWQKLANFYEVSVPYLQGIEPDFSEITERTKLVISLLLDNYYFGNKRDYVISYDVGTKAFDVTNIRKKGWKLYFSKYPISKSESRKTYDYVNKYVDLTDKAFPTSMQFDEILDYWMRNFSFLLREKSLIDFINRRLYRYDHIEGMTRAKFVSACDVLVSKINQNIYAKIVDDFGTDLGKYMVQGKYNNELDVLESNFKLSLRTADSIKSMRETIKDYETALNSIVDKVKQDKTNGKLEKYIKQDREREKAVQEVNGFYKEFDDLYKKDKEFQEFANAFQAKHPVGIKIVDKTGKVISSHGIAKSNKLQSLYLYKDEKGKDTTKLFELLVLLANNNIIPEY